METNALNDVELINIIKKLKLADYESQEQRDNALDILESIYPEISELIFWDKRNLTPEEILEEAKKRNKPILL